MDNIKTDKYYVSKILENIEIILKYSNGKEYEELISDDVLIDGILFRLIQLAENVNKLTYEFKDKHKNIKWYQISGFRNNIVHDYGKTDYTIVYKIITEDLIELKNELITIR